jgi:hypothetical protein
MRTSLILFLAPWLVCADDFPSVYDSEKDQNGKPTTPEDAAEAFQVPEGFEVTVFAAEPNVRNPIAMALGWTEADVGCRELYLRRKGKTI